MLRFLVNFLKVLKKQKKRWCSYSSCSLRQFFKALKVLSQEKKKGPLSLSLVFFCPLFFMNKAVSGLLPVPATKLAEELDQLTYFLVEISTLASILVIGGFIYFSIRFRRKSDKDKPPVITHNYLLEFLWSFIPFLIFMFVFGWGWLLYDKIRDHPKNALEIHVYGQMWNWDFVYKNGRKSTRVLTVPVGKPVKLIMSSRDVLHSFFIPSFRIKQDVLPNTYTALSFTATKRGKFPVFCAEFCGTGHSSMLAEVHVMGLKEWEQWLATDPYKGMTMFQIGESVFQKQCIVCHKINQEKRIGPGMGGLFGSAREFEKGKSLIADENYIRESVLNPAIRVVKGYPNAMTPFAGLLKEEEMTGLIEYIKSLGENKASAPADKVESAPTNKEVPLNKQMNKQMNKQIDKPKQMNKQTSPAEKQTSPADKK